MKHIPEPRLREGYLQLYIDEHLARNADRLKYKDFIGNVRRRSNEDDIFKEGYLKV